MKNYYFRYDLQESNYLQIFAVFRLAKANKKRGITLINYNSLTELNKNITDNFPVNSNRNSLAELLKRGDGLYWHYKPIEKEIILINQISEIKKTADKARFIMLSAREIDFIYNCGIARKELFARYMMYLKYYASKCPTDFTENQFLSAIGLSITGNGNRAFLSEANKLLKLNKIIEIEVRQDEKGYKRNIYSYCL